MKHAGPIAVMANNFSCPPVRPRVQSPFSGSRLPFEDTEVLAVTDTLGRVCTFVAFLPAALVVSSLPPTGCVVTSNACAALYQLERAWGGWSGQLWVDASIPNNYPNSSPALRLHTLNSERALGEIPKSVAPTYTQVVSEVQDTFGLHTTDLAGLLGVSRQSVHSWRSESGSKPSASSAQKLMAIWVLAKEWQQTAVGPFPTWLLGTLIQGKTLKQWLTDAAMGKVALAEIARILSAVSGTQSPASMAPARRERIEPTAFQDFVDGLLDSDLPARNEREGDR